MASSKPLLFVILLNMIYPLFLLVVFASCKRVPLFITSVLTTAYSWQLCKITLPFFFSPLRKLPQPNDVSFFLGHKSVLMSSPPGSDALDMMQSTPNEGLILLRGYAHCRTRLLVTSPEAIMDVLTRRQSDFPKPTLVKHLMELLIGKGLVSSEGLVHMHQRKLVAPAFYGHHVRDLVPIFWSKALEMVAIVDSRQAGGNGVVDMCDLASQATLDIVGVAALGRDLKSMQNGDDELNQQYQHLVHSSEPLLNYFIAKALLPEWLVALLPFTGRKLTANLGVALHQVARGLVRDKKIAMKDGKGSLVDILSVMLARGEQNEEELAEQLLTILFAGYENDPTVCFCLKLLMKNSHETTASALTWACLALSENTHVQERLRRELSATMASAEPDTPVVNAKTLDSITYLEAVCNEVLRLYPPVPQTVREASQDTEIARQFVPRGTLVVVCPWATNRLPEFWGSDASFFNPDRWINSDGSLNSLGGAPSQYCELSFLHGPKGCVGRSFAKLELKCLIAALILRFRIELADPSRSVQPFGIITIKPRDGLHLKLTKI